MNFHFNSTSLSNGVLIDIHSDKGGVGKTFFTDSLKAFLTSMGIGVRVFRIESRYSTAARVGDILIETESFADANDLVGGMSALYEPIWDAACEKKGAVIVDWGAGLTTPRGQIYKTSNLSQLIEGAGVDAISCVVTDATAPVLRQAAEALAIDRQIVPSMRRVLICNALRGTFEFEAHSREAKIYESELVPELRGAVRVNLPQIPSNAWQPFAAADLSLEDVLGRKPAVLAEKIGQSPYRTTSCMSLIHGWWAQVQPEFARLLAVETATA